ncbi:hypothetical protein Agabi119p4_8644 [Agaricus bisporus var. burnettii]|uniref:Gfo/Idh/MocA-like oxidoreductase N-terminal domain-containing protein n=1 Tax=Agaricus bisporus var. burnettii TaxID=192524 RepID=A0A8H7C4Z3_AGABI|nr:hypothetical protein Agabi119p4_8644 [Agaricus bisporus var. burnettii]
MSGISGVAILGAGLFAKEAHLPALAALGASAPPLKAVYSRSEKSAKDLAQTAATILKLSSPPSVYFDNDSSSNLDVLLARSDISSVIVILPITTQPAIVLKALAAGKHVISEKPVAADVQSGLKLIADYNSNFKSKNLIWRVAENFEAEAGYQAAAAAIRAGKIGQVHSFKAEKIDYIDTETKWYKTPWRTIPDYQGGFLLDGGVHTIAALRVMLPHPLTHVSGFASLNKAYLAPHDTIHAIVQAGPGVSGVADLIFASPTKSRPAGSEFAILGTNGWLSVNHVSKPGVSGSVIRVIIHSIIKSKDGTEVEEKEEIIDEPGIGVQAELASFFAAISGKDDGKGLGDPLAALGDVAFIQAALNSGGNLVDLTQLLRGD